MSRLRAAGGKLYLSASSLTGLLGLVGSAIHIRDSGMPTYNRYAKHDPTGIMNTPVAYGLAAIGKVAGCGVIGVIAGVPIAVYYGGKELRDGHA